MSIDLANQNRKHLALCNLDYRNPLCYSMDAVGRWRGPHCIIYLYYCWYTVHNMNISFSPSLAMWIIIASVRESVNKWLVNEASMHQCTVLDSEPAPHHSRLHQACVNTQRSRVTVQRSRITAQWRTESHRAPQSVCATVQHYSYRDLSMGSVALYVSAHYCHSEPQMDQGLLMDVSTNALKVNKCRC
jgi:hypothetical protein